MASKTRIARLEQQLKPGEPDQVIRVRYGNYTDEEWAAAKARGDVISIKVEPDPARVLYGQSN